MRHRLVRVQRQRACHVERPHPLSGTAISDQECSGVLLLSLVSLNTAAIRHLPRRATLCAPPSTHWR